MEQTFAVSCIVGHAPLKDPIVMQLDRFRGEPAAPWQR
jgi:hypothetical protein